MEGSNYQGENDGYAGEVLGHLEQIMQEQNAGDEYFDEPEPRVRPGLRAGSRGSGGDGRRHPRPAPGVSLTATPPTGC
jgi:hypothetical protein